jgi:hypothetical protein
MIHLARDVGGTPGAIAIRRVVLGDQVETDITLGGMRLRGVLLPCAALTLDEVAAAEMSAGSRDDSEERVVARGRLLHLRGYPGRGSQIDMEFDEQPDAIEFLRTDTDGPWWRVSHVWLDGTSVDGWVHRDELMPKKGGVLHDSPGFEPPTPVSCSREPRARNNEQLARGTVTPGTRVYAARGIGPWATVKTLEPVTLRYLSHDDWMEIVSVPGLVSAAECPEKSTVLEDAWVPRSAVKLLPPPAETTP